MKESRMNHNCNKNISVKKHKNYLTLGLNNAYKNTMQSDTKNISYKFYTKYHNRLDLSMNLKPDLKISF